MISFAWQTRTKMKTKQNINSVKIRARGENGSSLSFALTTVTCRRLNCTPATSRVDGLRVDVWRIPCCKCSVVLRDVNVFGCIRSSCPRLSYAFIHLGFHEQFWCNESYAGRQHPMQTLHPPIDRHRVSLSRSLDFSSSRTV